jgi:hypothetical protein
MAEPRKNMRAADQIAVLARHRRKSSSVVLRLAWHCCRIDGGIKTGEGAIGELDLRASVASSDQINLEHQPRAGSFWAEAERLPSETNAL